MGWLGYPLKHPYPSKLYEAITIVLIVIVLPVLVFINFVTQGFELVPVLRPTPTPNDTVPGWWHSSGLAPIMRYRKPPPCLPRDIGRGDKIRLTPSLFEYQVQTVWLNPGENGIEANRAPYNGESFQNCYPYLVRFDYSLLDWTQTITSNVWCPGAVGLEMRSSVTFADQRSKDFVANYYADSNDVHDMLAESDWHDYRKAVLGILDVISTDSLTMMGWSRAQLSPPILSLSTEINLRYNLWVFGETYVTYMNGTASRSKILTGPLAFIYVDVINNLVTAVVDAIYLDLRSPSPNIFTDPSRINKVFSPARPPSNVSLDDWVDEAEAWSFGHITPPYRTWGQMVLAGLPKNITLGDLTGWPEDSQMVTNYLCPTYQRKPISPLLASVFIGTASMFMSAWGVWVVVSAFFAESSCNPCKGCVFTEDSLKKSCDGKKHSEPPSWWDNIVNRLLNLVGRRPAS